MANFHKGIYVRVMAGQDLKPVNRVGRTSDPYAVLTIERTGYKHETDACRNSLNPTWYSRCIFSGKLLFVVVFLF